MTKFTVISVAFCTLLGFAFSELALAQGGGSFVEKGKPAPEPASSSKDMVDAEGRKITVVNFDDALIEGKARGPDGFVLRSRQSGSFRSILELRRDFRSEVTVDGGGTVPVVPMSP
jgi:hypothetical protein